MSIRLWLKLSNNKGQTTFYENSLNWNTGDIFIIDGIVCVHVQAQRDRNCMQESFINTPSICVTFLFSFFISQELTIFKVSPGNGSLLILNTYSSPYVRLYDLSGK